MDFIWMCFLSSYHEGIICSLLFWVVFWDLNEALWENRERADWDDLCIPIRENVALFLTAVTDMFWDHAYMWKASPTIEDQAGSQSGLQQTSNKVSASKGGLIMCLMADLSTRSAGPPSGFCWCIRAARPEQKLTLLDQAWGNWHNYTLKSG